MWEYYLLSMLEFIYGVYFRALESRSVVMVKQSHRGQGSEKLSIV